MAKAITAIKLQAVSIHLADYALSERLVVQYANICEYINEYMRSFKKV